MESLVRHFRVAARRLGREPGFTSVAAVTLALGIGGNVAVFSVVRAVVLRPLPYAEPERLVSLWGAWPADDIARISITGGDFRDLREQTRTFEGIAALASIRQNATTGGTPFQAQVGWVSRDFFGVLGVVPALGRDFSADEPPGSVLLGHGFWKRRFGSDPAVVGRTLTLDDRVFTVVGVLPEEFSLLLAADAGISTQIDLWRPADPTQNPGRWVSQDLNDSNLRLIGRLATGVSIDQAQADVDAVTARLRSTHADHAGKRFQVRAVPLHADVVGHVQPILAALVGAVALVLLIACANVANLMLARAHARQREVAIRAALGARPAAIAAQVLAESALLGALGGLGGVLLARATLRAVVALAPAGIPRLDQVALDGSVLGFAALAALGSSLAFGLVTVVRALHRDLAGALRNRTSVESRVAGVRLTRALVVGQIALSLALLIGAGLVLRSLGQLDSVRPGFEPDGVLSFSVNLPGSRYSVPDGTTAFLKRFETALARIPGVESVGCVWPLPLEGQVWAGPWVVPGRETADQTPPLADYRLASPGYFDTLGIHVVAGRGFDESDVDTVVVDEAFARRAWPGGTALDQRVGIAAVGNEVTQFRVVGVVENVRHARLDQPGRETVYLPARGWTWADWELAVVVRSGRNPDSLAGEIQATLADLDADIPVAKMRPLSAYVDRALAPGRFALAGLAAFAGLAVALSCVGLYGVIASALRGRVRDVAVRLALGASRRQVFAQSLWEGLRLVAAGVVLGCTGAWALRGYLAHLLFGVRPADPTTYAATVALVVAVACAACWLPAWRAASVDPSRTLRAD